MELEGLLNERLDLIKQNLKKLRDEQKQVKLFLELCQNENIENILFANRTIASKALTDPLFRNDEIDSLVKEVEKKVTQLVIDFKNTMPDLLESKSINFDINYTPYRIIVNRFFFIEINSKEYSITVSTRNTSNMSKCPIRNEKAIKMLEKVEELVFGASKVDYGLLVKKILAFFEVNQGERIIELEKLFKYLKSSSKGFDRGKKYTLDFFVADLAYLIKNQEEISDSRFMIKNSEKGYIIPGFEEAGNYAYLELMKG